MQYSLGNGNLNKNWTFTSVTITTRALDYEKPGKIAVCFLRTNRFSETGKHIPQRLINSPVITTTTNYSVIWRST